MSRQIKPHIYRDGDAWTIHYPAADRTVACDSWADAMRYVATHDETGAPE